MDGRKRWTDAVYDSLSAKLCLRPKKLTDIRCSKDKKKQFFDYWLIILLCYLDVGKNIIQNKTYVKV